MDAKMELNNNSLNSSNRKDTINFNHLSNFVSTSNPENNNNSMITNNLCFNTKENNNSSTSFFSSPNSNFNIQNPLENKSSLNTSTTKNTTIHSWGILAEHLIQLHSTLNDSILPLWLQQLSQDIGVHGSPESNIHLPLDQVSLLVKALRKSRTIETLSSLACLYDIDPEYYNVSAYTQLCHLCSRVSSLVTLTFLRNINPVSFLNQEQDADQNHQNDKMSCHQSIYQTLEIISPLLTSLFSSLRLKALTAATSSPIDLGTRTHSLSEDEKMFMGSGFDSFPEQFLPIDNVNVNSGESVDENSSPSSPVWSEYSLCSSPSPSPSISYHSIEKTDSLTSTRNISSESPSLISCSSSSSASSDKSHIGFDNSSNDYFFDKHSERESHLNPSFDRDEILSFDHPQNSSWLSSSLEDKNCTESLWGKVPESMKINHDKDDVEIRFQRGNGKGFPLQKKWLTPRKSKLRVVGPMSRKNKKRNYDGMTLKFKLKK